MTEEESMPPALARRIEEIVDIHPDRAWIRQVVAAALRHADLMPLGDAGPERFVREFYYPH